MFLNMSNNSGPDVVYEGWLTKSPPAKRIFKARWRRRWFVLKHTGELPGQYFLLYYTDNNCRKLKGKIDLDQCEQVDAGLRFENSKQNYPHMFDLKTPKRTYYLAADNDSDMNRWVDCVCQVCGLKATVEDTSVEFSEEMNDDVFNTPSECADTESPPVSPTSSVSGPYIPISECISGKPLNTPLGISDFNNILTKQALIASENTARHNSKDEVNIMYQPQSNNNHTIQPIREVNIQKTICSDDISKSNDGKPVTVVMTTYGEKTKSKETKNNKLSNVETAARNKDTDVIINDEFYDSPRKIFVNTTNSENAVPTPNWDTFPTQESDYFTSDIGSWSVQKCFGRLMVVDSKGTPIVTNSLNRNRQKQQVLNTMSLKRSLAPPRPPKPSHLIIPENHSYLNIENVSPATTPHSAKSEKSVSSPKQAVASSPSPVVVSSPNSVVASSPKQIIASSPNQVITSDETYDIPRSHQSNESTEEPGVAKSHNYTNAAPSQVSGNVFRYDFTDAALVESTGEPISPRSINSQSGIVYSNLPSPLVTGSGIPTPPAVNRELKPSRKMSESGASNEPSPGGPFTPLSMKEPSPGGPFTPLSMKEPSPGGPFTPLSMKEPSPATPLTPLSIKESSPSGSMNGGLAEASPGAFYPPCIDRKLKPKKMHSEGALKLAPPPDGTRRVRAAPSPTPPFTPTGKNGRSVSEFSGSEEDPRYSPDEQIYFYEDKDNRYVPAGANKDHFKLQYLDLDLELENSDKASLASVPSPPGPSSTVYKTVDFLKTEAFNRTRVTQEKKRTEEENLIQSTQVTIE